MNNAKNTTLFPYLERLLEGEAVEWKTLGEVAELYTGLSGKNKEHFKKGNAPYVTYKNIFENLAVDSSILEMVRIEADERQHSIKYGDILITGSSENIEEVGMASVVTFHPETGIYLNSFSFGIRFHPTVQLSPEFTKYLFRSDLLRKQIMKTASGVTRFNVSKKKFSAIIIPIPPLRVQARIVEILDKFTQLEAELEARKKQYAYYRDQLLNFLQFHSPNVNIEWKTLGEVCDRTKGTKITATQMKAMHKSNAPVKIFAGGQTFALVDYNDLPPKDIYFFPSIIVKSRGIIEFEYYDKPFSHKSELWSYHTSSPDVNAKFLYYYLKTREDHFQQLGSVMQMPQISIPATENFPIPLPPLSEQRRIVDILDRFDTLTNSISEGLPKEIALRRKQYEYYRDALLNFPRPEATA